MSRRRVIVALILSYVSSFGPSVSTMIGILIEKAETLNKSTYKEHLDNEAESKELAAQSLRHKVPPEYTSSIPNRATVRLRGRMRKTS